LATLLSWSDQDYGYRPALCNAVLVRLDDGWWYLTNGSAGVPPWHYPLSGRRPAARERLHTWLYEGSGNEDEDMQGRPHGSRIEVGVLLVNPADLGGLTEEDARWFPSEPPTRYVAKLGVELPGLLVSIRVTVFIT
jgi:hypothetical protein